MGTRTEAVVRMRRFGAAASSPRAFDYFCALSGVLCALFFFIPFLTSNFLPPLKPTRTAEQVVSHYRRHEAGIKVGTCLMAISSTFYLLYTAAISSAMQRIPGVTHLMTAAQLCSGALAGATFLFPAIAFSITVFRVERAPELTLLLNDISWLTLVIPWMPFMSQNLAFGFAVLVDKRPLPLFPPWFGWMNIISTFIFTPGMAVHCTKTGPVAWNGVLAFWVPAASFFVQFVLNAWYLVKALRLDRDMKRASTSDPSDESVVVPV